MNSVLQNYWSVMDGYMALRGQALVLLSDDDLGFSPSPGNPTLGELIRSSGEVEQAYIDGFRTFEQDFSYRNTSGVERSLEALWDWLDALDEELEATLEALSDDDVANRTIDRGGGFAPPVQINLHIYRESLLIFYGKLSVYLKALGKTLPERWASWIG